jgi:hypothetical protein
MPVRPVPVDPAFTRTPDQKGVIDQKFADGVGAGEVPIKAATLYERGPQTVDSTNEALRQRAGSGK